MMKRINFKACRFGSKDSSKSNSNLKRSTKNGSSKTLKTQATTEEDHTYDPTDCSLSTVTGIVTEAPRSVASAPVVRTKVATSHARSNTSSKTTTSNAKKSSKTSASSAAGDLATTSVMEESHASLEKLYEQATSTLTDVRAAITQYTAALEVSRANRTNKLSIAQARLESGNRTGAILSTRQVLKVQHEGRQLEKALHFLNTHKSGLVRYTRDCKAALRTSNTSAIQNLALQGKAFEKTVARAQKLVAQKPKETEALSDEALLEKLESMI